MTEAYFEARLKFQALRFPGDAGNPLSVFLSNWKFPESQIFREKGVFENLLAPIPNRASQNENVQHPN